MISIPDTLIRRLRCAGLGVILLGPATFAMAQVPIVHPGAPGEPARDLSADEAIEIADTSYSPADVKFMHDMIPHHHQALEMAALVEERTNRPELIDVAGRIKGSQGDEIAFMQQWLRGRGEHVPEPTAHEAMHTSHEMAGMATPEQMAELAASKGSEFDRLFLTLMIKHHEGAVTISARRHARERTMATSRSNSWWSSSSRARVRMGTWATCPACGTTHDFLTATRASSSSWVGSTRTQPTAPSVSSAGSRSRTCAESA